MSLRSKILLTLESFLRVPPLLLIDEILRHSFGLGISAKLTEIGVQELQDNSTTSQFTIENGVWFSLITQSWIWQTFFSYLPELGSILPNSSVPTHSSTVPLENIESLSLDSEYLLHISLGNTDWNVIHQTFSNDLLRCAEVLACLILFTSMVIVFVLSTQNLIKLYISYISLVVIYAAYILTPIQLSSWLVLTEFNNICNIVIRFALSLVYILTSSWTNSHNQNQNEETSNFYNYLIVPLFFITGFVRLSPVIYIFLVLLLETNIRRNIVTVANFLKVSWDETKRIRHEFGINHLIHVHSGRLRLNSVFKLFWITKASYDALYQCCDTTPDQLFKYVMTHGTETLTGVVGITAVVSSIANLFGDLILWILYYGSNSESDANRFGSISTVLFFILSLQTGLTTLAPDKRLDRLTKNFALLVTALLHALHQMISPVLHAYRTLHWLQIRAIALSLTFLGFSVFATVWMVKSCAVSTWSLAVLALALEFQVKIIVSLIIVAVLYMSQLIAYPAPVRGVGKCARHVCPQFVVKFCDEISHEDLVFYLKTFANFTEFVTGIFLFCNAIWIFLFESASAIRAIGMSIHAYFNIWCEAKKGWKIYCQRRTAAVKIQSLIDASDEQLMEKKDDVCAICYEEMENAKVTFCGHLFHAVCLRKWLYLQNTCPLCHDLLYSEDALVAPAPDPNGVERNLTDVRLRLANANAMRFYNIRREQESAERILGEEESDSADDEESSTDSDDNDNNLEIEEEPQAPQRNDGIILLL